MGRIFAKPLRVETLPKRRKDCKMPAKPASRDVEEQHALNRTFHRR
jgi:hypothetical protein